VKLSGEDVKQYTVPNLTYPWGKDFPPQEGVEGYRF
jgi:hypothetical protein